MKTYTLCIPTGDWNVVESLSSGDSVKLIFEPGESMWVTVKDLQSDGSYTGILDNHPVTEVGLKLGDAVSFELKHIKSYKAVNRFDMMKLHTEDLKRMGYTIFCEGTNTVFLCSIQTVNMEAIFIREILRPLGYKILSEKDWLLHDGHPDDLAIRITTDYPWSDYQAL